MLRGAEGAAGTADGKLLITGDVSNRVTIQFGDMCKKERTLQPSRNVVLVLFRLEFCRQTISFIAETVVIVALGRSGW